jgi:hypothetical protein
MDYVFVGLYVETITGYLGCKRIASFNLKALINFFFASTEIMNCLLLSSFQVSGLDDISYDIKWLRLTASGYALLNVSV